MLRWWEWDGEWERCENGRWWEDEMVMVDGERMRWDGRWDGERMRGGRMRL